VGPQKENQAVTFIRGCLFFDLAMKVAMNRCLQYDILESLPVYGSMHVSIAQNDKPFYSEGFPIRFYKTDGTSWVANFEFGCTSLSAVYELPDTPNVLVIAGGSCYLMNPDHKRPLTAWGISYEKVLCMANGSLVLQDLTNLTIVERDGTYWTTERISWDGFKNLEVKGNTIEGFAYDPMNTTNEWIEFLYNTESKELTGGSYPNS